MLGFGAFSDQGVDFRPLGGTLISDFQAVTRDADRRPDKNGQYGFNVKYFAPDFNNGTEFGVYFLNYHSRLPVISGRTGTAAGVANAWGAANAAQAAALGLAGGLPAAAAIAAGAQAGVAASRTNALRFVGDLSLAQATEYATIAARTLLAGGGTAGVGVQATNLATHEYAKTARYFVEYPEDIQMIGLSFNTQIQTGGIALQGEVTYRKDVPLQYDDVELLFAALTPFEAGLGLLNAMAPAGTPLTAFAPPACTTVSTLNACNQLGRYDVNQEVRGWGLHDTWQAQFTATKTFANVLKASQMVVVLESAVSHIPDLPSKISGGPHGRGLRYNGPGTSVSGNAELASRHFNEVEPLNRFADSTSWGYRFAGRLEYPGLMGPWNVVPRFSWQHDVSGTSPGPGGNFVEGRYGLTLGVAANLQATLGGGLRVDHLRRRRSLQRHQRSRLRRRQRQVFVLMGASPHDGSLAMIKKALLFACATALTGARRDACAGPRSAPRMPRASAPSSRRSARRRARNAAGTIPAWDGGLDSAAKAGFANFKPGSHHPDPFAADKPLYTITQGQHGPVRQRADRGPQEAADHLSDVQDERLPDAPQRRGAAAHLRRDQAHRDHRAARARRQWRGQRGRGHPVPDAEGRRRGVLEPRAALPRRRHLRAPSARRRSRPAAATRW